jgi:chromosome segregation ATPase
MDDIVGELRDCAADSQQVGYRSRAQEAMLRAADDIVALQGQSNRQCDMVNKLVATLETVTTERDALRAERDELNETLGAHEDRLQQLRAELAEARKIGIALQRTVTEQSAMLDAHEK